MSTVPTKAQKSVPAGLSSRPRHLRIHTSNGSDDLLGVVAKFDMLTLKQILSDE
jgi:hypothetical protein